MRLPLTVSLSTLVLVALLSGPLTVLGTDSAGRQEAAGEPLGEEFRPLPMHKLLVQGLHRTVRFYRPARLAERPALLIALHGGGGDGERFRRLTAGAFERLADQHGFLVAYPDGLGGHWHGCRAEAPYREVLAKVDEVSFLGAVAKEAQRLIGRSLGEIFVVGYSNGGHLVFRLALEAPNEFAALAAIGAHLPIEEQLDCRVTGSAVSMFLVSGTKDPINPWAGGEVVSPGGGSLGQVLSAGTTAEYFRELAGLPANPTVKRYPDADTSDGTWVETRRWHAAGRKEIILLIIHGGGHVLPHPTAPFPTRIVGRVSRDLNAAEVIWNFFARHLDHSSGQ